MTDGFYIMKREDAQDLPLPTYMTPGAAGMDLYANVFEPVLISPGKIATIPTGISISIPIEYEAQIRPRSGLAHKYGVTMVNAPGTVDADYRGEIRVILINLGERDFIVNRGDRIAQMVIAPVAHPTFTLVNALDQTERQENGFGHTGVSQRQTPEV